MKITIGILSYNMPHLTDVLYNKLRSIVKIDAEYIILDNGSDDDKKAKCTTHYKKQNTRLTGGMNSILSESKGSDYVWLCTNDIDFKTDIDPVASMIKACESNTDIGCIHPSLIEPVPNYAFQWMINKNIGVTTGHPMVDIICPFLTKKALDINNWELDSRFTYGWGIDYDMCYKIRCSGMKIAVDHNIIATHQTSVTYDSGMDKEFKNRNEYYNKAMENMNLVMSEKYGINWRQLILG